VKRRQRRREALAEIEKHYDRILSEIVHQQHWIIFSAEFIDTDHACRAMNELSFFNKGKLTPVIRGGVFPYDGTTVLLGGELTREQVDEIAYVLVAQAQKFDIASGLPT
jgi:hypothetical protein